jgi:hypothetical protein
MKSNLGIIILATIGAIAIVAIIATPLILSRMSDSTEAAAWKDMRRSRLGDIEHAVPNWQPPREAKRLSGS